MWIYSIFIKIHFVVVLFSLPHIPPNGFIHRHVRSPISSGVFVLFLTMRDEITGAVRASIDLHLPPPRPPQAKVQPIASRTRQPDNPLVWHPGPIQPPSADGARCGAEYSTLRGKGHVSLYTKPTARAERSFCRRDMAGDFDHRSMALQTLPRAVLQ